ncbi:arsenate reductase ArsC [Nocardioides sp. SYSU DS0663]|uniref:arsenate reductase ArsC n=1 Tax=Nocardioides sp. SYSU DS0663 TaxID=3416445 RepID=UPI003F4C489D
MTDPDTLNDTRAASSQDAVLPGISDPRDLLHAGAHRLATRFAGHFAEETIERYLFESYAALKRTARVTHHLPVLAETFAADRLTALAQSQGTIATGVPEVLLVCVHNAGRSQMAAALLDHHGRGRVHVRSAGSQPAAELDPAVVTAMEEVGLDLSREYPKPLTDDVVRAADVVITMGCGDACPIYPGKTYLDWALDDPAGRPVEEVRLIRDAIENRVLAVLAELAPAT